MRFVEEGPSIPDELLLARDQGKVVFFCGSGVSKARVSLPDFFSLADQVTKSLGVLSDSPAMRVLEEAKAIENRTRVPGLISADRVFGLLEREFLAEDIERDIASALLPSAMSYPLDLTAHRILLDLATDPEGQTRLVTTNFDRLFEQCGTVYDTHVASQLPNPSDPNLFRGICYLHGRISNSYDSSDGERLVISSADFGRAYLSEGWATSFVKDVAKNYSVVFVGYSADDPPIRYLLEGLGRSNQDLKKIYAFQDGKSEVAKARWADKGVHPIAFEAANGFAPLWKTLEAWADRARNVEQWYEKVVERALIGPSQLMSFERGQIAHIISHSRGARKFSSHKTPPPADWLCVFDSLRRYASPASDLIWDEQIGVEYDPFSYYGLDSDTSPSEPNLNIAYQGRSVPEGAWDAFALTRDDLTNLLEKDVVSFRDWAHRPGQLPDRLFYLATWISNVCAQPAAIWWAAQQNCLHPDTISLIRQKISRTSDDGDELVWKAWNLLFQTWESTPRFIRDHENQLSSRVRREGWSNWAVGSFVEQWKPYLVAKSPTASKPIPPSEEEISLWRLMELDIKYPDKPHGIEVPDEWLVRVIAEMRLVLNSTVQLADQYDTYDLSNISILNEKAGKTGLRTDLVNSLSGHIFYFVSLFRRLVKYNHDDAFKEYSVWKHDGSVFSRLIVWASGLDGFLPTELCAQNLIELNRDVFWNYYHQADIMLSMAQIWNSLSHIDRDRLELKILNGPSYSEIDDVDGKLKSGAAAMTLDRLHWLSSQGCNFAFDLQALTIQFSKIAPNWSPERAALLISNSQPSVFSVSSDENPSQLKNLPIGQILDEAKHLEGRGFDMTVESNPYRGLCRNYPVRVLRILCFEAAKGNFSDWAWGEFFYARDVERDSDRLSLLIAARLSQLPDGALNARFRSYCYWLRGAVKRIASADTKLAKVLVNRGIDILLSNPDLGDTHFSRKNKRRNWFQEVSGTEANLLYEAILNALSEEDVKEGQAIPKSHLLQIERLLCAPTVTRQSTLVSLAKELSWLHQRSPDWVKQNLISVLEQNDGQDIEAFWYGFFHNPRVQDQKLFCALKPYLLKIAFDPMFESERWAEEWIDTVFDAWRCLDKGTSERWVSNCELHSLLVKATERARFHLLWRIGRGVPERSMMPDRWNCDILLFLRVIWPRHKHVKSPEATQRLLEIAIEDEDQFEGRLEALLPHLTNSSQISSIFHRLKKPENKIVEEYTSGLLDLMIKVLPENRMDWPYNAEDVFERMRAANPSIENDPRWKELRPL